MRRASLSAFCTFLMLVAAASPAAAKSYAADRYDSAIRILQDGTLEVTETVVFHFTDGTFKQVHREIPTRRVDDIEILRAEADGVVFPAGTGAGQAEIRHRSNNVRVLWRFAPFDAPATKTLTLLYRVRGAMRQTDTTDMLHWRALPGDHDYRIASSTITYDTPARLAVVPTTTTRRVGTVRTAVEGSQVIVRGDEIRTNGWIETELAFPRGSILAAPSAWQQRQMRAREMAPQWYLTAGAIFAVGLVLLIAWRQSYDAPPRDLRREHHETLSMHPPDGTPAALAGVLAANGRASLQHAMAIVFALADRGVITIEEQSRGVFSQRNFLVRRTGAGVPLTPYEQVVLDTIFGDSSGEATVTLAKARGRVTRGQSKFAAAINRELTRAGLLDEGRKAVRDRYNVAGIVFIILAVLTVVPIALMMREFGPFHILVPVAFGLLGVTAFIFGATITPLTNEGVRRAEAWRAYAAHLKRVARGKEDAAGVGLASLLPVAVALGLASVWSKYLKHRPGATPAWFHSLGGAHDDGAFPIFVAHGGAGSDGGGASGGGGGAAGGGSSGAS